MCRALDTRHEYRSGPGPPVEDLGAREPGNPRSSSSSHFVGDVVLLVRLPSTCSLDTQKRRELGAVAPHP